MKLKNLVMFLLLIFVSRCGSAQIQVPLDEIHDLQVTGLGTDVKTQILYLEPSLVQQLTGSSVDQKDCKSEGDEADRQILCKVVIITSSSSSLANGVQAFIQNYQQLHGRDDADIKITKRLISAIAKSDNSSLDKWIKKAAALPSGTRESIRKRLDVVRNFVQNEQKVSFDKAYDALKPTEPKGDDK